MKNSVKELRRKLKPALDFDFWVRAFDDGRIWCGANYDSEKRMNQMLEVLKAEGYKTKTNGKPGTAGAYIIEIVS